MKLARTLYHLAGWSLVAFLLIAGGCEAAGVLGRMR